MSELKNKEIWWTDWDDAGRRIHRSFDVEYQMVGDEVDISGVWTDEDIYDLLICPETGRLLFARLKAEIQDYKEEKQEELEKADRRNRLADMAYDERRDME